MYDPSGYNACFRPYDGPLVAGGNPACGRTGGVRFFGLLMGQNQHGLVAFDTLFKALEQEGARIGRIVDLGTSHGGFTVFLQLYAATAGAMVITWDVSTNEAQHGDLLHRLGAASLPLAPRPCGIALPHLHNTLLQHFRFAARL